ncbi:hypothetical protein CRG98_027969 [Punica granatum]|uniref:Dynamin-related protein 4C-like n=1 Tax=Punica granatum TaxID=22663 RepID=A0A2I0J621_PUNGR|nr:hypothetical protein CRG98_027969 [Punica granatum]
MEPNPLDNQLSNGFLAVVPHPEPRPLATHPPIVSSYNDHIRPILDAVDRLRNLQVMKEGIQLPTIVVVGDQSSGKSSVLESLAGISLPRGQGICTRVPLIMRLQNYLSPEPELYLEFNGKIVQTDEENVTCAIGSATEEIAGRQKGISNTPLTLVVKKDGVPDLTMVDLPGITRVPVHGQPEDIYEQKSGMIMEYIRPEESIILNVLSATVDFSTCESIRMSQMVDKTGHRTLGVVTKADKAPEGLFEKVTADDVNIGLGYVCIMGSAKDSLSKILLRGEYDEYPHEKQMHGTARFIEMLDRFANELQGDPESDQKSNFLMEEIAVLEEAKGICLKNFLPRTAFLTILHRKVEDISSKPSKLMIELWDYIQGVVITVLMDHSKNYPPLQASMRRAAQNLITKMKERAMSRVMEIIEMEKLTDYTCDPEYISEWNKLMGEEPKLLEAINNESFGKPYTVSLVGIGEVEIDHLRRFKHHLQQAFDLKMRMTSYWKIVQRRLVDTMAMFMLFNVQVLVNREMEVEIVNDLVGPQGGGIERMLEESPSVAIKREKLQGSIKLLRESAEIVATIVHRAATSADLD